MGFYYIPVQIVNQAYLSFWQLQLNDGGGAFWAWVVILILRKKGSVRRYASGADDNRRE